MGIKRTLIKKIKSNTVAYKLYQGSFNLALNIEKLFMPTEKKILFTSFSGERFDDSPQVLYEKMIRMPEFAEYEFVWAFRKPQNFEIPVGRKIEFDSFSYYKEAITSKIWITNVSIERGLYFKKKSTIYVNTWHGTPIKRLNTPATKHVLDDVDIFCVQSEYGRRILEPHYKLKKDAVIFSDYPRNDELFSYRQEDIQNIRRQIGIPDGKKVVLYMPTYRAYTKDAENNLYMAPPIHLDTWKKKLGDDYVVLFRLHYLVEKQMDIPNDGFSYSVTGYPKLSDLYAVADILISDYSSAFFDYGILGRPMLCFAYDRKEYTEQTGLYMELEELGLPICYEENSLIEAIQNCPDRSDAFIRKFPAQAGHASDLVIQKIIEKLKA